MGRDSGQRLVGTTIAGRYQLRAVLGRGGMATVYRAYQPALDREVAVKVIAPWLADDATFAERFRREARTVARLRHRHILTIHDFGEEGDFLYLVTELIEGGTLHARLREPRSLAQSLDLLDQVGQALDHAHAHGVVHRDVKPHNVFLERDRDGDRAILADFGIAKASQESGSAGLTATGMGIGTPEYMAPEQLLGQPVDGRADLYALAVMAYQLTTGRLPFDRQGADDTPVALALRKISATPSLPSAIDPRLPPAVDRVLLRGLATRPDERYPTAKAFVAALREAFPAKPAAGPAWSVMPTVPLMRQALPPPATAPAEPAAPPPPTPTDGGGAVAAPPAAPPAASRFEPDRRRPTPALIGGLLLGILALGVLGALLGRWALAGTGATGGTATAPPGTAIVAASSPTAAVEVGHTPTASGVPTPPATSTPTGIIAPTSVLGPGPTPDSRPQPTMPATATASPTETPPPTRPPTAVPTAVPTATPTARPAFAGQSFATLRGHSDYVISVSWSPDGKTLASGSYDGEVRLWSATGQLIARIDAHDGHVLSVAWSPDGRTLASGGSDNVVRLWGNDGKPLAGLSGHENWVISVAWSPDGRRLASGSADYTIRLWDPAARRELRVLREHRETIRSVAWSPDGRTLASGSVDRTVKLWSAEGTLIRTFAEHGERVIEVAWSPDGRMLASASADKTIRIWNSAGQVLRTLTGHDAPVLSVAWSPTGTLIATGSDDRTLRLWGVDGTPLNTLTLHTGPVRGLAWSPDLILASASWDTTVRLWR